MRHTDVHCWVSRKKKVSSRAGSYLETLCRKTSARTSFDCWGRQRIFAIGMILLTRVARTARGVSGELDDEVGQNGYEVQV